MKPKEKINKTESKYYDAIFWTKKDFNFMGPKASIVGL